MALIKHIQKVICFLSRYVSLLPMPLSQSHRDSLSECVTGIIEGALPIESMRMDDGCEIYRMHADLN